MPLAFEVALIRAFVTAWWHSRLHWVGRRDELRMVAHGHAVRFEIHTQTVPYCETCSGKLKPAMTRAVQKETKQ